MPALVIERSSSPTLKIATPRTPTGIFCESTPSTSSSALSADIPRYCAFCITGHDERAAAGDDLEDPIPDGPCP